MPSSRISRSTISRLVPVHAGSVPGAGTSPRTCAIGAIAPLLLLAACGALGIGRPPGAPGQIPDDYRLARGRALVIARIDVATNGKPGFGPVPNPMLIQFHPGVGLSPADAGALTIPDLNPLSVNDPNVGPEAYEGAQPTWHFAPSGMLALPLRPGSYDGLIVFYPDTLRSDRPVDSIPAPDRPLTFAPLRLEPERIVYVGDITVRQHVSWTDLLLDRIGMDYAVVDRFAQTAADFRARYPQFRRVEIEKRLLTPTACGPPPVGAAASTNPRLAAQ